MSVTVPVVRTRRNFTKADKVAAFARAKGLCEGIRQDGQRCNAVLIPGRWRCDHITPDAMGGEPVLENAQCLCPLCDGEKTPKDISNIADAKALEASNLGIKGESAHKFPGNRQSSVKAAVGGGAKPRAKAESRHAPPLPRPPLFVDI